VCWRLANMIHIAVSLHCRKMKTTSIQFNFLFYTTTISHNAMIMNNLVKKAFSTGLHIAVFAGEKLHEAMGSIIEKSKTIQERYNTEAEEADEEEEVTAKKATAKSKKADAKSKEAEAEAVKDEAESEEATEAKPSLWEEYEHKLRRLVETAISKFNFIRNDDHSRMEERISILEEKLSYIAQLVADQNEESSK
jgi:Sec-independent protein translocase protein TatA